MSGILGFLTTAVQWKLCLVSDDIESSELFKASSVWSFKCATHGLVYEIEMYSSYADYVVELR